MDKTIIFVCVQNEYTTAVACVVYFYTADGKLVAKHAVAGADVTALAWHRSGLVH